MKPLRIKYIVLLLIIEISGCAKHVSFSLEEAIPDLKNLTRQVEFAVNMDELTLEKGERALLDAASVDEPSHLQYLDKYYFVRANIINNHAVILLCTKDRKIGLVETIACDDVEPRRHSESDIPCEYTYTDEEILSICGN